VTESENRLGRTAHAMREIGKTIVRLARVNLFTLMETSTKATG
jgi:hypothetical protein